MIVKEDTTEEIEIAKKKPRTRRAIREETTTEIVTEEILREEIVSIREETEDMQEEIETIEASRFLTFFRKTVCCQKAGRREEDRKEKVEQGAQL